MNQLRDDHIFRSTRIVAAVIVPVLVGAVMNSSDFPGGLLNWYLISIFLVLVGMVVLYDYMENGRRQHNSSPSA